MWSCLDLSKCHATHDIVLHQVLYHSGHTHCHLRHRHHPFCLSLRAHSSVSVPNRRCGKEAKRENTVWRGERTIHKENKIWLPEFCRLWWRPNRTPRQLGSCWYPETWSGVLQFVCTSIPSWWRWLHKCLHCHYLCSGQRLVATREWVEIWPSWGRTWHCWIRAQDICRQ